MEETKKEPEQKEVVNENKKAEWKKNLKIVIAMLLVAVVSVGGTLAYLSDKSDEKQNVFVGSAGIDLELKEEFDDEDAKDYTPGMVITKSPTLKNTSSTSTYYEWVAIKVSYVKDCATDGTGGTAVNYSELTDKVIKEINFKADTLGTSGTNDWIKLKTADTYSIFVYKTSLKSGAETSALFDEVEIQNPVKTWDGVEITTDNISSGAQTLPSFRIDVIGAAVKDEENGGSLDWHKNFTTADTDENKIGNALIDLLEGNKKKSE